MKEKINRFTGITMVIIMLLGGMANGQKSWEIVSYYNNINITAYNYDFLGLREPSVKYQDAGKINFYNYTYSRVGGDSLVAYIYMNRKGYGVGSIKRYNIKYGETDFRDSTFLENPRAIIGKQLVTIKINNIFLLENSNLEELFVKAKVLNKFLQTVEINGIDILILRTKLESNDSLIITSNDKRTGRLLDKYIFQKIDAKPSIIGTYDLSKKDQFSRLMRNRDSLQLSEIGSYYLGNKINVSPLHNDLLILLKRFSGADSLRIEYRLLKGNVSDSDSWNITENEIPILQFNNLERGEDYILQLRYNLTPNVINEYKIKVGIFWWQILYVQLLGAFIAGIVFMGIGWIIYKGNKERQLIVKEEKRKKLELELSSIRAQLNPHFIFNALGTLQSLINKVEIESANIYLSRVSILIRYALENSIKPMASLEDEFEYLKNYLEIESFRFKFNYTFEIDDAIPMKDVEIPSMLIQPIAENAIKHGLSKIVNGNLIISICREQNDINITIHDNGPGFDGNMRKGGYGLRLTKERIALQNSMLEKEQIKFDCYSSNAGTKCVFKFENWL